MGKTNLGLIEDHPEYYMSAEQWAKQINKKIDDATRRKIKMMNELQALGRLRLLICGDREWSDYDSIKDVLGMINPKRIDVVIEGECRGADTLARMAAESLRIKVLKYPAKWLLYGRKAGPIRNKQMLVEGKPNVVIAFHDDIENSRGTQDMLNQADKRNIPSYLISHE